jgi:putative addiction module component (TIGR02574 family)
MTQRPDSAKLRALPAADRLELIEELWDSLTADALPLPDWHRTEIDRRLDALDKGESVGAPWEEVRRRITGEP